MSLEFEWNDEKAAQNLRKHDFSFLEAIDVFDDPAAIVRYDDRGDYGEDRFIHIGLSHGEIIRVVYTLRGENRIRIISASRATPNEEKITVVRRRSDGKLVQVMPDGTEKVLRVKPIPHWSDEQIEAAARNDLDNPPLTKEQLAKMHRVPKVRTLRFSLGLAQEEFAKRYQIPLATLREWERGRAEPDETARAYIEVIANDPERVREILRRAQRKMPKRSTRRRARASA